MGDQGGSVAMGSSNASTAQTNFVPLVKIKQEDTSMDEEETIAPQPSWKEKYKHLLKTFEVKVEPLGNLKAKASRLFKSQRTDIASAAIATATASLSKPSNVSLTSFTKMKSPQANTKAKLKKVKSPSKSTLTSSSDSDSNMTKNSTKKKTSLPQTNGPNILFQKPDNLKGPISRTPRLIAMKDPPGESGKKQKVAPPSPRKVLQPDDLRYLIAPKEGMGKDSVIEKEVEPELEQDLDEDLEEDLDSMSIHADDDDLLDSDNELGDLNELGKTFAAASSEKKKEPKPRGSVSKSNKTSQGKRKHSEGNVEQTKMMRLENSTAKPAIQESSNSTAKPAIQESRNLTAKPAVPESRSQSDGDMKQNKNENKNANPRRTSNSNEKRKRGRKRGNSTEARNLVDEHRLNNRPNNSPGLLPTPGVSSDVPMGLGPRIPRYSDKQERRTSDDNDNRGRWRPQQQQNGDVFMPGANFEARGRAPRPFRANFQQQLAPMHRGGQGMRFMRLPFVQQFQNRPEFQQRPGHRPPFDSAPNQDFQQGPPFDHAPKQDFQKRPQFDHAPRQDFQQRPPFDHAPNQGPRMQASNFMPNGFKGPHGNTHIPPLMMQERNRHPAWHKGDIVPEETGASLPDATINKGNGIISNPGNDQKVSKLYEGLTNCCGTGDFSECVMICREILKTSGDINVRFLESLVKVAAEQATKIDSEILTFIFENIRKAREKTGYKADDFNYAIEAFLQICNVDSAIDLALEMRGRGFLLKKSLLSSIKTGIFECSINNMDRVIEFCDELERHNLISNRLVEEILKHTTIDELRSKTKSEKILNMLKDVKVPEQPLLSPTLQISSPTWNDEVATMIQKISEISPPENIPSDHIVQLIDCIKTPAHAFLVTGRLSKLPREVLSSVCSETWNEFLMKSCDGPFAHLQLASQIQGIMASNGITVQNTLSFQIVCSLLKADLPKDALRILHKIDLDGLTAEDITDETNTCLCDLLTREEICDVADANKIIMILIKGERNPPENKVVHLISLLKDSASYQEIDDIIKQMQIANITPSWETYNIAFSALENWDDNPEAVIEVFSAMKRSYPKSRVIKDTPIKYSFGSASSISSLSTPRTFEAKDTESLSIDKVPRSGTRVCNYFNNGEHCPHGDKCRFSHMLPAPSLKSPFEEILNAQARSEPTTSTRKNSLDLNKQDSGYTSNGSANHPITTARSISSESSVYSADYRRFFNRMMLAAQSHDFKSVCKLYAEMRNKDVELDNPISLAIYKILLEDKPSERFDCLSQVVKSEVPVIHTINEEEEETDRAASPLILLQDADQENLGRLAVQLIFHCVENNDFVEAYKILHLLHALQINYYIFGEAFEDTKPNRTPCEITMTAVKICLRLDDPQLDGALEVLRSTNYGPPTVAGGTLTSDDVVLRNSVLMELTDYLLQKGQFEDAYEVLEQLDPKDATSAASFREFNSLLLRYSTEDDVENATMLYEFMTSKELKYDHKAFSTYLNCMARNNQFDHARELFKIGAKFEIYPPQEMTDPYMFELPCSLTQFEMLFMLEEHLKKIRRTVFEGKGEIKPLMKVQSGFQIIFKENYELYETSQEQNAIAKENMAYVLTEMMKPPLKVIETENPDEPIVIGFNSIMGWYTNKPGNGMQPPNLSDHSTPVTSPPTRRAVQIKEGTNIDTTSEPLLTITASTDMRGDDVTTRTVGRQLSVDREMDKKTMSDIITKAVCERTQHYLLMKRVSPEAFENCCHTLSRTCINRLSQNGLLQATQESKDKLVKGAFNFVDVFFDEHDTFVRKP